MEIAARMSSKGQVTVPKAVRDALGIGEGDNVVFRVEGRKLVKHGEADVGNWSQGAVFSPDSRTLLVQNMVQKDIQVFAVDGSGVRDTSQRIALKAGPASIRAAR